MRLRLARICRTGDVLAEHAAFRRQRPEFFDVVNRGTAVSFALLDDPQLHHLVICLISRQADTVLFTKQRRASPDDGLITQSIRAAATAGVLLCFVEKLTAPTGAFMEM